MSVTARLRLASPDEEYPRPGRRRHGQIQSPARRWAPDGRHAYVVVGSDNRHGGQLAGEHMAAMGRQRLAFLGDVDHPELARRFEGFREAVAAHGGEVVAHVACDFTTASGQDAAARLVGSGARFDGVFACSDLVAVGAVNALTAAGLNVPRDVSIVGYDDAPLAAAFSPALTTVRQNRHSGGRLLAAKILEMIGGGAAHAWCLGGIRVEPVAGDDLHPGGFPSIRRR